MKIPVLLLLGLTTTACATGYEVKTARQPTVHPFQPPGASATVCVLRPQWFALAVPVVQHDNGRLVGLTRGGSVYFCWRAQPGWHRITAARASGWGQNQHGVARVRRHLRPGQRLYLRTHLAFFGADRLTPVHETQARRLIPRLRYVITHKWSRKMQAVHRGVVPALHTRHPGRAAGSPPRASSGPPEPPDTRYASPPPPPQPPAKNSK